MKEPLTQTRKLGPLFYILLIALTAVLVAFLGVWAATGNDLFLYLMLGVFPLYVFHLIYHLVRTDKDYKKQDALRSEFFAVARDENAKVVYLTYFGNEKRVKKPSAKRRDYLIEFYSPGVDLELLKRHLWFDLSDREEEALIRYRIGALEIPYAFLEEVKDKTVLVQAEFFRAAEGSPLFASLFAKNEIHLYGQ